MGALDFDDIREIVGDSHTFALCSSCYLIEKLLSKFLNSLGTVHIHTAMQITPNIKVWMV